VLGKQSGKASIRTKLSELNMQCAEKHIPHILERIKAKNGIVSNREFAKIVSECLA
jgi:isopropylmalate/homocitrate/citramalate synthase